MKLVTYPDKRLSRPATDTTHKKGLKIAEDLRQAVREVEWGVPVGMAAPQIGKGDRVFLAFDKVFINPQIVWSSKGTKWAREGCYSLQKDAHYGQFRSQSVIVRYINEAGEAVEERFNGKMAQVIQHEYDHLEGKVCSEGATSKSGPQMHPFEGQLKTTKPVSKKALRKHTRRARKAELVA